VAQSRLSRPQIEQVLRRAAELEANRPGGDPEDGGATALSEQDVLRLGEEAGLSEASLQHALAELRRGHLVPLDRDGLDRALGSRQIVVTREVPGPAAPVRRAIERFLREQLMTVRRHHGDRVEWERARGLWPGLARSLDFARRYAFGPVTRVETVVVAEGEHSTSVTFRIDLTELRRHRLLRACLRASAAFSIFGLGGALFFPGFGLEDVVSLLAGGAAAGGLMALERRRFEENRAHVTLAPERFLDLLVLRRQRALVAAPAPAGAASDE
jgi:DNA-binding transcriptional ArsR family regulator